MKADESNNYFVAGNAEELLFALEKKEPYISIPKHFKEEFMKNTQLPLTEKEQMGFELGSHGTANLLSSPLFHFINWLSKDSKQQKRIDSKIRKYTLKSQEDGLLLYLHQLDY